MKTHWSKYLDAIGKTGTPASAHTFQNTSTQIGVSGFLDIKPTNTEFQTKYDAMSATWEGVHASEKATLKFKSDQTEFMPFSSK